VPLRLGVLHIGRPESGVRRYGRIVAEEAARRPGVSVTEVDAGLLEGRAGGLGRRGAALRDADAVLLQWNRRGWGRGVRGAYRYLDFRRAYRGPLIATLHDVFAPEGVRERWLDAETWALRLLGRTADRLVVHSDAEVGRLAGVVPLDKVRVVPHFVEERRLPLTAEEARAKLGVSDRRVLTLLGFIYGRKGHRVAIEAVPSLPDDCLLVFAGGPIAGREGAVRAIVQRADELRLGDRFRITGYLPEEDLETWMTATHLALLPFKDLSASGSLSSWIAAGKPILASDLPGFREYDACVPGALRLFGPPDPEPLAAAIREQLDAGLPDIDPAVVALREELTVAKTADRYLAVIREAVAARG
jgi:glycosyltransferase involved in cell wall biosynthesis